MIGIKRIEKISDEVIRARAGFANISEKINMVMPCGEKAWRRCNENMEVGGHRQFGVML